MQVSMWYIPPFSGKLWYNVFLPILVAMVKENITSGHHTLGRGMCIVITLPVFFDDEADRIAQLLKSGRVDLVHIRKPESTEEEVEALLSSIPEDLRGRLVLHDHHCLASRYGVYGVHLNGRNPVPPKGWQGSVSRSCHTLNEVMEWKERCDYVSLSPIYDSVSKKEYLSAFTREELIEAHRQGIIDDRVYALGGVTFDSISDTLALGFGGVMILGDAWK